jgi:hypothetical protein
MIRHAALTIGLALTLPFAGAWANDPAGEQYGTPNAGTVHTHPGAEDSMEPDPAVRIQEVPSETPAAPDMYGQTDTDETGALQNGEPESGTVAAPMPEAGMEARAPLVAAGTIHTPLQEFVSHQVHEIGELSQQMEIFKTAGRQDMVQALYHMIRDHSLASDAAQNVLARRGDVSKPVTLFSEHAMPSSPEEVIRHDIMMHEQMLDRVQQYLANADSAAERSIYQHALNGTQKHLDWLRTADQGQRLSLGFFGRTMPLSLIAGSREEIGTPSGTGNGARNMNGNRGGSRRNY